MTGRDILSRMLRRLGRDTRAATAVEYGLILALIVIALIGALDAVASQTTRMWNKVDNAVATSR